MHRRACWAIGALSAFVLILTAESQIYDNNFYSLAETPGLLAGDHPYRDFFDWGVPLQAGMSVVMQTLVGYRLIGEFALQWTLMTAGVVMAFQIAVRLSGSSRMAMAAMLVAVVNLAATPTVHSSKLFIYPCAILLMWRYLDRPGVGRSAAMGVVAAVAFLLRHDHGVYVGTGVLLAFVLARVADPDARLVRPIAAELAAAALGAAVLVGPWAIVVQQSEGLANYVQARAFINDKWAAEMSARSRSEG